MTKYKIAEPNCIQIEPAEGCTLACSFCALQTLRDNGADRELEVHGTKGSSPFRFFDVAGAHFVASEMARLKWTSRIEFAMHGEPTANPKIVEIIAAFRSHLPENSLMLTSNGSGINKDPEAMITALFAAGLNTLVLDDYAHSQFLSRIKPWLEETGSMLFPVYHYPKDKGKKDANPHHRSSAQRIFVIADITQNTDGTHKLTNQGGNSGGAAKKNLLRRCAKPFREMAIRWDGNVALCCDDWPGKYKIGNVFELGLEGIWHHDHFEAARRRLYAKDRNFGPCKGCDVTTPRDGILPDKQGKDTMSAPDKESDSFIGAALKGQPFSIKLTK